MLYSQLMVVFGILFVTLIVYRSYLLHRAGVRRTLVPVRLAERKRRHAERVAERERRRVEELECITRMRYVRDTLEDLPLLIAAHYAPKRRAVRPG